MTYIDNINQAATAANADNLTPDKTDEAALGKQDFLTLLVAQLQNQDPLNPDDPTEFTAQLAQFSSLEQLFNLNDSMDSMAASVQQSDKLSALQTIGKDVVYDSSDFSFNGEPVEIGYKLDGQASQVQLYIQKAGTTIAIIDGQQLSQGTHFITWDGLTQNGQPAPQGDYSIVLQAKAPEGQSIAASPIVKSEVTGVDLEGQVGGTLITAAGQVGFTSILGVYDKKADGASTKKSDSEDEESTLEQAADLVEDTNDLVEDTEDLAEELTS